MFIFFSPILWIEIWGTRWKSFSQYLFLGGIIFLYVNNIKVHVQFIKHEYRAINWFKINCISITVEVNFLFGTIVQIPKRGKLWNYAFLKVLIFHQMFMELENIVRLIFIAITCREGAQARVFHGFHQIIWGKSTVIFFVKIGFLANI